MTAFWVGMFVVAVVFLLCLEPQEGGRLRRKRESSWPRMTEKLAVILVSLKGGDTNAD